MPAVLHPDSVRAEESDAGMPKVAMVRDEVL
jgi:hypothetical protein